MQHHQQGWSVAEMFLSPLNLIKNDNDDDDNDQNAHSNWEPHYSNPLLSLSTQLWHIRVNHIRNKSVILI